MLPIPNLFKMKKGKSDSWINYYNKELLTKMTKKENRQLINNANKELPKWRKENRAAELIIPIKNLLKNDERRKSCSCINNANKELA
jgi:hypothetical protein